MFDESYFKNLHCQHDKNMFLVMKQLANLIGIWLVMPLFYGAKVDDVTCSSKSKCQLNSHCFMCMLEVSKCI